MSKKIKISLNSTLSETILDQAIIEQTIKGGYYDGMTVDQLKDYGNSQRNSGSARTGEEMRYFKSWITKRDSVARKIVSEKWETWTIGNSSCGSSIGADFSSCSDQQFYEKYHLGIEDLPAPGKNWKYHVAVKQGVDWKIRHIEEGEPGWCAKWWHCVLPIIEIGVLFIPFIGWGLALGLSMTVGLADALLYYNEGDDQTAGLVAFLTILPGVPGIVKKFPFVKSWGKTGAKKMAGKIIAGENITLLEKYQLKALTTDSAEKFIKKEVTDQLAEQAVKQGAKDVGVELTEDMVKNILKYTKPQQKFLIKFAKQAAPYVAAGVAYTVIYNKIAKSGAMGPKKLIERLWGIDVDDTSEVKITKFFQKVSDPESEIDDNIKTKWDYIKFIFNSSGSAKDGELMVQAIKNGWNPYKEGKSVVPKKYRTEGYREWVNNILSNEALLTWFGSDGSDEDNYLLLGLIFEDPGFNPGTTAVPEKYRTETYKKNLEKRTKQDKVKKKSIDFEADDEGEEYIDIFSD